MSEMFKKTMIVCSVCKKEIKEATRIRFVSYTSAKASIVNSHDNDFCSTDCLINFIERETIKQEVKNGK